MSRATLPAPGPPCPAAPAGSIPSEWGSPGAFPAIKLMPVTGEAAAPAADVAPGTRPGTPQSWGPWLPPRSRRPTASRRCCRCPPCRTPSRQSALRPRARQPGRCGELDSHRSACTPPGQGLLTAWKSHPPGQAAACPTWQVCGIGDRAQGSPQVLCNAWPLRLLSRLLREQGLLGAAAGGPPDVRGGGAPPARAARGAERRERRRRRRQRGQLQLICQQHSCVFHPLDYQDTEECASRGP